MPASLKYIYRDPLPQRLEDVERLQPVFRRACNVRIVWLDGKPVRAERVQAAESGSPWERLVDWLRSLLGLEGGRSWSISARDARSIVEQRLSIEWAWWCAHRADRATATDGIAAGADIHSTSDRTCNARSLPVPPHVPPTVWRQVCRFLQPDDVLALAGVDKEAKRAVPGQALVARAMREASNVASLSAMLAVIDDMASWHGRQDPAWPVPVFDRATILASLAARVRVLLCGQRAAACAALLDAAARLDHVGARADLLAAIAHALDRVWEGDRQAVADRLLRMILALPRERQYAALSAVLDSSRTSEAQSAFAAFACTANNWMAVVERLPASVRDRTGRNLVRALLEVERAHVRQGMPPARIAEAMLVDVDRLGPDSAATRALVLETIASAWVLSGNAERDGARWRSLFELGCALPARWFEPLMHCLRGRLRELPEAAAAACISAFRSWLETASLSTSQRIELGAGLILLLPQEDRRVYWHARWTDWRNGRYDDETDAIRLADRLIKTLWCVPSLAGWPAPLNDRQGSAPLAPALRARLLTMLPWDAMRDDPASMAAVVEESMRLAERHDTPGAALWWYTAGSLSRSQRRSVESLFGRMEPAWWFDTLSALMQDEARSPSVATVAMNRLEKPPVSAQELPARIRLATLMAWHYEEELRAGNALLERLVPIRTLVDELEASTAVQAQLDLATAMAVLGNTTARAASLCKRPGEMSAAGAIVQRIWCWIERTPGPMRMAIVWALLDRRPGLGRNPAATLYDYLSRSSLPHIIELASRSASSVPTAQRGDMLVALATAQVEAGSAGFDAARQAQWTLLRSAVPGPHRLRMLAGAGPWITDAPKDHSLRSMWLDCLAEYAGLCARLPDADRACVAHWLRAAQAALSLAARPGGLDATNSLVL